LNAAIRINAFRGEDMVPSDERDRYGEKLRQVEQARENQWAAERDRELLGRMRRQAEERVATKEQQGETLKVFSRILCPIDLDQNALPVANLAGRLASQNDAELYLLHVCPTVFIPLSGAVTDGVIAERSARQTMEEIASKLSHDLHCQILVTTGDAAERVSSIQSALDIDLIVIGTHGRRAVPRFFLGSVAERVVREAMCPVLTIRQDHATREEIS
jgi:nucleotide-binding universal stress UspA family protein